MTVTLNIIIISDFAGLHDSFLLFIDAIVQMRVFITDPNSYVGKALSQTFTDDQHEVTFPLTVRSHH